MSECSCNRSENSIKNVFIIGGGIIYKELFGYCDRLYITRIHKSFDNVDTYFPNFDNEHWYLNDISEIKEHNGIKYHFCIYDKK